MNHDLADTFAQEVDRRASEQRLDVFLSSRDAGHALTSDRLKAGISLRYLIDTAADRHGTRTKPLRSSETSTS